MRSVEWCSSAEAVQGLLALVAAASPIVDVTYGNGTFWAGAPALPFGFDLDRARALSCVADFLALPLGDASVPTIVFDPPFHPSGANSAEAPRFRSAGRTEVELKAIFQAGCRECWRVTHRHLLVKCQGFVHNHRPQWMPLWAIEICGEPFEWLIVGRDHKRTSGRWTSIRSLRRNHADYLIFDKQGNHR